MDQFVQILHRERGCYFEVRVGRVEIDDGSLALDFHSAGCQVHAQHLNRIPAELHLGVQRELGGTRNLGEETRMSAEEMAHR